ncbi:hypothetical protein CO711_31400 [Burkholderia cepacia]|uniref:Uncharacterized protein n=2 Tax=Burkholderia cepacia TaxID=292 RepID=A0ABM6P3S1_BURCE|nr:hypothetical protein CO711_31400 [Burkholderia cepacia]
MKEQIMDNSASPVEQPAPITAQDALAAIETFEIVGENNSSRAPNADDRFILSEFIAHLFGGYPVKQPAAAPIDERSREFAAVDMFAATMKDKLDDARTKGRSGWEQCDPAELSRMLREHVGKGDPRDVANLCMFLWALGKPITAPSPADERAAFEWPTLPLLPEAVITSSDGKAVFTAHQMQGYANAYGEMVRIRAASANETGGGRGDRRTAAVSLLRRRTEVHDAQRRSQLRRRSDRLYEMRLQHARRIR